ncbi:hypothetical protein M2447_001845 [Ereboglobus sp. PH5-10]|nr:hypothetical protein [Ereboglobus sp. PH5-10]MDF9827746.1 hypothetical protein [Ereboglobus sp. PH5-10]
MRATSGVICGFASALIALATAAALTIALGIWPDVVLGLFK